MAGVEVSVDGGATWHLAQGRASWSYEWVTGAVGPATLRTRAIDDSGNLEIAGGGITVTVTASGTGNINLWPPSTIPPVADAGDPNAVELGVKFRSDVTGSITGVRFYKSATNVGTHVGNLWTNDGALLARVTFADETPSGWQQMLFDVPVPVTANVRYVVSYHTNVGHYAAAGAYFSSAGVDALPLHAGPSTPSETNGVFLYGATAFPTSHFNATNYWVDVVFSSVADTMAPIIGDVSATATDSADAVVSWTTSEDATSRIDYSTVDAHFRPRRP